MHTPQIGNLFFSLAPLMGGGDSGGDGKASISAETRNELFMLRTTTQGLSSSLEEFIELIGQREDVSQRGVRMREEREDLMADM